MALTNIQKASARRYLGFSLLYSQVNPELEGQFIAVGGLTDGGATEAQIIDILGQLAAVEAKITALLDDLEADKVDELRVDPSRARLALCAQGRMLVTSLEVVFNCRRRRDVFSGYSAGLAA